MIPVFDYRNITKEHKDAAEEISNLLIEMNQPMLAELIKLKFNVVERPKYNMEDSNFVHACKDAGIYCSIQGHTIDNGLEYPLVSICEDVRKFNKLYDIIKNDHSSRG